MPITARISIAVANVCAASGNSPRLNRTRPYAPSLSSTAARSTEPAVGASVWASGSQVWSGNSGTFTANATKKAAKSQRAVVAGRSRPASARTSNVGPSGSAPDAR